MSGIYKLIDVVGTSPVSFAEAVKNAVSEAGKTVHHMNWFEVIEERVHRIHGEIELVSGDTGTEVRVSMPAFAAQR